MDCLAVTQSKAEASRQIMSDWAADLKAHPRPFATALGLHFAALALDIGNEAAEQDIWAPQKWLELSVRCPSTVVDTISMTGYPNGP